VPEWAQGLTEAQRKALLASGQMPWWWDQGQAEWDKQRQILRDAKLRSDRSLEGEWLREIAGESSLEKKRKGDLIYNQKLDAWEKAPWHADVIESMRT
jgi:hypothetical protein